MIKNGQEFHPLYHSSMLYFSTIEALISTCVGTNNECAAFTDFREIKQT